MFVMFQRRNKSKLLTNKFYFMKKKFLISFLFCTIIASAARVVRFTGSCGLSTTMSFADGTTDAQVASAFAAWNWTHCGTYITNVRIVKIVAVPD
jgi:hypothetical protein